MFGVTTTKSGEFRQLLVWEFQYRYTLGVTVIFISLSGAQGGKGLVFALQESPGRYPSLTNVLMISQTSEHCHRIGFVYSCLLQHNNTDP